MNYLTPQGCDLRRRRLTTALNERRMEAALLTDVREVFYFTGLLIPQDLPVALVLDADGRSLLVAPRGVDAEGVDEAVPFDWNQLGTRDPDIPGRLIAALKPALASHRRWRLGVQEQSLSSRLRDAVQDVGAAKLVALDDLLADMESRKDEDELALVRGSVRANLGAYRAVRDAIHPGVTELDVLAAGWRGAMNTAGEKVFHDGDYQCGQYNGPARNRVIEAGEMYIVDAWTCYRGYWSDMSRTFAVGRAPTDVQRDLFEHIRWLLAEVEKLLRPGVDGRQIFRALDEMLREHPPLAEQGLIHHGGHSIGLRAHEMPDINRDRGGDLAPGNVVCIEPGGYFAEARYGVRLEHMYLITPTGCENLCDDELVLHVCE